MRWARPKSLTGLMLLGLALIAVPLLVAVVDAVIQIRRLAAQSEELVQEGVQGARLSQTMFADIASLQRTVRLYNVLAKPELLEAYRTNDQRLAATRTQLAALLTNESSRRALEEFGSLHNEISTSVGSTPPGSVSFATILTRIDRLGDLASAIALSGNQLIDTRLEALQQQTTGTQKRLFWQSALLVPLTLIAILS